MKLTDKSIAALTLDGRRDAIHFDGELRGFGYRLRAGAGGKTLRTWIVQYRRAGASRRMLLGPAEVLNAEAARAKAKKALARIWQGDDPQAEKAERRIKDRATMRAIVDAYIADRQADWRAQTLRDNRRYLTAGPYFGALHGMAIDKISRRDVGSRLVAIKREHSAIVAAAARAKLSAFFTWCMRQGLTESNPTIGTGERRRTAARERVLSDSELAAIWNACDGGDHAAVTRLLILLGARRREVGGMAWSEIDLAAPQPTWTLPKERAKNGRPHTLPLLPMALDIIRSTPRMVMRDQLFGSHSANGFAGWDKLKHALDEHSRVRDWTLHDVRRSVATRMADIGIAPHVVEQILNHRSGHRVGVAGVYNKSPYEREVRNAMALWEDHVAALVAEGGERRVLNFPAAT